MFTIACYSAAGRFRACRGEVASTDSIAVTAVKRQHTALATARCTCRIGSGSVRLGWHTGGDDPTH